MKSSSGVHFIALDHVRALAAFMVVAWHFTHGGAGFPVPFEYVPALPPFALLDEGHTGVALFMTLSGYLFAKLLDGKTIRYGAFLWNRALRLLPLLVVVIVLAGLRTFAYGGNVPEYLRLTAQGVVLPTFPNGGWSITVEFHYYLILPAFLWLLARGKLLPLGIVAAAIALRLGIWFVRGEAQWLAYWTLVGRVDQFALGMLAFHHRHLVTKRHLPMALAMGAFVLFYWYFDAKGGFYLNPTYPSPDPLWIVMPTVEGLAYAAGIAWYDSSFEHRPGRVSAFVGRLGDYSYSIYLLHFFLVFGAARFVDRRIMHLSNFYVACTWAFVFFVGMLVPGHLSYKFIEEPFLRLRRRYVVAPGEASGGRRASV